MRDERAEEERESDENVSRSTRRIDLQGSHQFCKPLGDPAELVYQSDTSLIPPSPLASLLLHLCRPRRPEAEKMKRDREIARVDECRVICT